jgi:hypothetical protein
MSAKNQKFRLLQPWEELYKEALFEVEIDRMAHRIELAKHAIFDRMEDVTCTRSKQDFQPGEVTSLRNAHRALKVLEELYFSDFDKRAA